MHVLLFIWRTISPGYRAWNRRVAAARAASLCGSAGYRVLGLAQMNRAGLPVGRPKPNGLGRPAARKFGPLAQGFGRPVRTGQLGLPVVDFLPKKNQHFILEKEILVELLGYALGLWPRPWDAAAGPENTPNFCFC